jgi:hypothetical protein
MHAAKLRWQPLGGGSGSGRTRTSISPQLLASPLNCSVSCGRLPSRILEMMVSRAPRLLLASRGKSAVPM